MARLLPPVLGTLTALGCVGAAAAQSWRAMAPPPRYGHCLGFAGGQLWLFGGTTNQGIASLRDLWQYTGARWTERTPALGPSPRLEAAMAFSLARNRLVLFGGTSVETLT